MQLGQLQDYAENFDEAGIGVLVVTYDSEELQQKFVDAGSITFPFISDIDASTMIALGILNENYEPGDSAYGVPHPGIFVVNPEQEIVGKIFVEDYAMRVSAEDTFSYALELLE